MAAFLFAKSDKHLQQRAEMKIKVIDQQGWFKQRIVCAEHSSIGKKVSVIF
ncbi:hypothetical protein ACFORK_18505 [Paenibacillus sp. GCM10012306]